MNCNTCDELLAEYKLWVSVFQDAVLNIPGALGDDARVLLEHADRMRLKSTHARRALMKHWRQEHPNLTGKAGSSEASA